jgi:hypothetical protein
MDLQGKGKDKRTMMHAEPKAKCKPKAKTAPSRAAKKEEEDAEKEDEDSWGGWSEGGFGEITDRTKGYELTVENVGGHTHMYLKEIVTRRGITAQLKIKTKEGEDTAVVSLRTKEEAQATLEAMEQHEDEIWPKMKWNWKPFNTFGDVYTKNPITPPGGKRKEKEDVAVAPRGTHWQEQKKESWDEGNWDHSWDQWLISAANQWGKHYTEHRLKNGPEPGKGPGEPAWVRRQDKAPWQKQRPYERYPAEKKEPQSTADSSGINKPIPSMSPALVKEKEEEKGEGKEAQEPQYGRRTSASSVPEPPQYLLDAVEEMRQNQSIVWKVVCREEMRKAHKDGVAASGIPKDTKRGKRSRSRSDRVIHKSRSPSEQTEGSLGFMKKERGKFARTKSPSRERSRTPTSRVSSTEAQRPVVARKAEGAKKRRKSPKRKNRERRYRKGETISSDPTDESEVIVKKSPRQGTKERSKERHKK